MFKNEPRLGRQIALEQDERPVRIHTKCGHIEAAVLALDRHMNVSADAEKHSLAAAPLFPCARALLSEAGRLYRGSRGFERSRSEPVKR